MRRSFLIFLMLGAFMFALSGIPFQMVNKDVGLVLQAHAEHSSGWNNEDDRGWNRQWRMIPDHSGNRGDDRCRGGENASIVWLVVDRDMPCRELALEDFGENAGDHFGEGRHFPNQGISSEWLWGQEHDGERSWKNGDHDRPVHHSIAYGFHDDGCDRDFRTQKHHHEHHRDCDHHKVPEPSMLGLLGAGLAGIGLFRIAGRRKGV
jgi:hypothetical protein